LSQQQKHLTLVSLASAEKAGKRDIARWFIHDGLDSISQAADLLNLELPQCAAQHDTNL
jgi:hypothetical protein